MQSGTTRSTSKPSTSTSTSISVALHSTPATGLAAGSPRFLASGSVLARGFHKLAQCAPALALPCPALKSRPLRQSSRIHIKPHKNAFLPPPDSRPSTSDFVLQNWTRIRALPAPLGRPQRIPFQNYRACARRPPSSWPPSAVPESR